MNNEKQPQTPVVEFNIGQVIYVLSNTAQKIIPAIVVEEVVVRTLKGNQTSWKVSVGPAGKEKVVDSSRLDGDIYTSLDAVKDALNQRLTRFLDDMIDQAHKRAVSWYGDKSSMQYAEPNGSKINPEHILDEIEDTTVPTVRPPSRSSSSSSSSSQGEPVKRYMDPQDMLRERMNRIIKEEGTQGSNDEGDEPAIIESGKMQLPDGQRVKVNLKI